jgi:hypothetical protein
MNKWRTYRESDVTHHPEDGGFRTTSSNPAELILLETEIRPLPSPEVELPGRGFFGRWFITVSDMYKTSDTVGRLILATALGSVGVIASISVASWVLPATPIGMALASGLAPLPVLLVLAWLIGVLGLLLVAPRK